MASTTDATTGNVFEALFGPQLLLSGGRSASTCEVLAGKAAVGIYFSAHWCPPCRGFTPQLAERYQALLAAGKEIQIVFVSSDREQSSFDDYFSSMPWAALPFDARETKSKLSSHFGVSGIPCLVFLDGNGNTITRNGRSAIQSKTYVEDFPFLPKPVVDLGDAGDTLSEPCVVALAEGANENDRNATKQALETVSIEERAKDTSEKQQKFNFLLGTDRGPLAPIRKVCGLPAIVRKHDHPLQHIPEDSMVWSCDGCSRRFSGAERYRCKTGCDFDLCSACNEKAETSTEIQQPVALLILDVEKSRYYLPSTVSSDTVVSENMVRDFLADYRANKLNAISFKED